MARVILRRLSLYLVLPIVLVVLASQWHLSTYKTVEEMVPLHLSQNKEASEHFIRAMSYRIHMGTLHKWFNYNNVVMKPFVLLKDYHLAEGKKLLPQDSVEDIFWWTLMHKDMYGIEGSKERKDTSLHYDQLPREEFLKVWDDLYAKIERYATGKIYSNTPFYIDNNNIMMAALVSGFSNFSTYAYPGKTALERTTNEFKDSNYRAKAKKVLTLYQSFVKEHLHAINDNQESRYDYLHTIVLLARDVMVCDLIQNPNLGISKSVCMHEEMGLIVQQLPALIDYAKNNKTHVANLIFDECLEENTILVRELVKKVMLPTCTSYYPELPSIYQNIQRINHEYNTRTN